MRIWRLISAVVFLFGMSCSWAQVAETMAEQRAEQDSLDVAAIEHIHALKDGVLLVRLATGSKAAEAMMEVGMTKDAEEHYAGEREINAEVMKAFANQWTFCDYYFFYDTVSSAIKAGDYSEVFDEEGNSVVLNTNPDSVYVLDSRNVYFEARGTSEKGYAIMDSQLDQLKDPFPYFIKKNDAIFIFRRSYNKMAELLNEKVVDFYQDN